MEVKYLEELFWIIDDDGKIIKELGGFIDFLSPLIIIGEVKKECVY